MARTGNDLSVSYIYKALGRRRATGDVTLTAPGVALARGLASASPLDSGAPALSHEIVKQSGRDSELCD
jgi:hypothetical protein